MAIETAGNYNAADFGYALLTHEGTYLRFFGTDLLPNARTSPASTTPLLFERKPLAAKDLGQAVQDNVKFAFCGIETCVVNLIGGISPT